MSKKKAAEVEKDSEIESTEPVSLPEELDAILAIQTPEQWYEVQKDVEYPLADRTATLAAGSRICSMTHDLEAVRAAGGILVEA